MSDSNKAVVGQLYERLNAGDLTVVDDVIFGRDNGIIVEHWGVMDTGALMQQLTGG